MGQRLQVVAPFQGEDQAATAQLVGHRLESVSEVDVAAEREPHPRQRVLPVRIVARRDEDQLRLEPLRQGPQQLVENARVALIADAGAQRHVADGALSLPRADLPPVAAAGIVGVLVRGEEEHRRIAPEGVLRAVAVVHVEIHDEHPLHAALGLGVAGGDGHVVEDAEAHAAAGDGVVARRPHQVETIRRLPLQHGVHQVHQAAGRQQRRVVGARGNVGVRVEVAAAPFSHALHRFHVGGRVHALQTFHAHRSGLHQSHAGQQSLLFQQIHRASEPLAVFRMAVKGVFLFQGMVAISYGHSAPRFQPYDLTLAL